MEEKEPKPLYEMAKEELANNHSKSENIGFVMILDKYEKRYNALVKMKNKYVDCIEHNHDPYYHPFDLFVLSCINSAIEKLQRDIEFEYTDCGDHFDMFKAGLMSLREHIMSLYDQYSYHDM